MLDEGRLYFLTDNKKIYTDINNSRYEFNPIVSYNFNLTKTTETEEVSIELSNLESNLNLSQDEIIVVVTPKSNIEDYNQASLQAIEIIYNESTGINTIKFTGNNNAYDGIINLLIIDPAINSRILASGTIAQEVVTVYKSNWLDNGDGTYTNNITTNSEGDIALVAVENQINSAYLNATNLVLQSTYQPNSDIQAKIINLSNDNSIEAILESEKWSNNKYTLTIDNFSSGIYLIVCTDNYQSYTAIKNVQLSNVTVDSLDFNFEASYSPSSDIAIKIIQLDNIANYYYASIANTSWLYNNDNWQTSIIQKLNLGNSDISPMIVCEDNEQEFNTITSVEYNNDGLILYTNSKPENNIDILIIDFKGGNN